MDKGLETFSFYLCVFFDVLFSMLYFKKLNKGERQMIFANLTEKEKQIFVSEATNLFHQPHLEDRHPGFPRILGNLIEKGHVLMVEESGEPRIQQHLLSFPYFQVEPSKEAFGCVEFTFDQETFLKSVEFKDSVQSKVDEATDIITEQEQRLESLQSLLSHI